MCLPSSISAFTRMGPLCYRCTGKPVCVYFKYLLVLLTSTLLNIILKCLTFWIILYQNSDLKKYTLQSHIKFICDCNVFFLHLMYFE